jgi:phosphoglucosamine mutase
MTQPRRLFGTDGIRGKANTDPMTAGVALRLGQAAGLLFTRGEHRHRVVIGKDTRLSGYMIEPALVAGFIGSGMDVTLVGPLPTPAIAMLTRSLRADLGVMISASHNGYEDNGIKLFGPDGFKLSDETEAAIEAMMDTRLHERLAAPDKLGRAARMEDAGGRYIESAKASFPRGLRLDGLKIVVDCANGAGYKVGPRLFADLGADIVPIGCSPNGRNINDGCGSTSPEFLQLTVPGVRAQVGIALDGDGDRVVMVDELGRCVDGDQLLYLLARARRDAGLLKGPVVGTVMSNLGLEHALAEAGIEFRRAQVGDRQVLAMLQELGGTLGGETSGHILCLDKTTTGDGLISALQVLAVMKSTGASLAELCAPMPKYPQVLLNVRVAQRFDPLSHPRILEVVESVERRFNGRGRTVLRASGTEPVIRVMVEGQDAKLVKAAARDIAAAVEAAAAEASGPSFAASSGTGALGLAVGGPRG